MATVSNAFTCMRNNDSVSKTISVYNQIAEEYAQALNDYTPDIERDRFVSLLPEGAAILDLGCAAGRDCIWFASKGFVPTGVDLSDKLLSIARKNAPQLTFHKKDVRDLDFPDASFDGIWACAVLLLLKRDEIQGVLRQCHWMLKKGGVLALLVKEGEGEGDVVEALSSGVSRHFTYFRKDEIEKYTTNAGCKIIDMYQWNSKDRYGPDRDVEWISCFARKE